jgi:hypothetical protein
MGRLHLKLGRIHQRLVAEEPGRYELAQEHFRSAERQGDPAVAVHARTALEELQRWKNEREAQQLLADLDKSGLLSRFWTGNDTDAGTHELLEDGTLRLRAAAEKAETLVYVETPPIESPGSFRTGLKMAAPALSERPGTSSAGIELRSSNGKLFQLLFDGATYRFAVGAGGGALRGADERSEDGWHTLAITYHADTRRVRVFVDGRQEGAFSLNLADVTIRVFLQARPGATSTVDFKGFQFRQ